MPSSLPPNFVDIHKAQSMLDSFVSIIGIVVDALPISQSGGTSLISTFTLMDSDLWRESWRGLKIRVFNDKEFALPTPQVGDAVLLRKIRVGVMLRYL
jgi:hypothetical protein